MILQEELTGAARWLVPLVVFGFVLLGGIVIRLLLLRMLTRWAAKTTSRLDDSLLLAIRWPSVLWIVLVAALAALQFVHLPGAHADRFVGRALAALFILSITLGVARFLSEAVQQYRSGIAPELAIASTGLLRTFVNVAVLLTGLLVMLSTLGISIAPVLGALGVGGLAAGLALQPTLSNLFAGFQIAVAKQIRLGQRVRLSSGEEGYVTDIAWRTTTLRTPGNSLVIIPNSKFADAILTNFNLPGPEVSVVVPVKVGLEADPRRVEAALLDEAKRAVAELPQLVKNVDPGVSLQSFADAALQFQVVFRVQDYDSQYAVWGELQLRLFTRVMREGFPLAIPPRAVYARNPAEEASAAPAQPAPPAPSAQPPR